jgi:hypothetical protein
MNDLITYPWQQSVLDAFLAAPEELSRSINIAERAILARLQESHELDFSEHVALDDALRALRVLICETTDQAKACKRDEHKNVA